MPRVDSSSQAPKIEKPPSEGPKRAEPQPEPQKQAAPAQKSEPPPPPPPSQKRESVDVKA